MTSEHVAKGTYSRSFYADRAAVIAPGARHVMAALIQLVQPGSVIDVGCGDGSFLAVMPEFGIADFVGVEGPWIGDDQLQIPRERLQRHDLNQPFASGRRFDLALSIEVAEHLVAERGPGFVGDLTRLADLVLFSAAIPGQGGTNHVNERWQSYWAGLFAQQDHAVIDGLRPVLWADAEVPVSWRQNMLLYAHERALERWPALAEARRLRAGNQIIDLVHPRYFWRYRKPRGLRHLVRRQLPEALRASMRQLRGDPASVAREPLP